MGIGGGAGSSLPLAINCCVEGREGGFVWCGTGSSPSGTSTLPLWTNTLAWGLATITRAGATITRPEGLFNSLAGSMKDFVTGRSGAGGGIGGGAAAGGLVEPRLETCWEGDFCGKSGVVFAVGGEPVRGGAEGFGGAWVGPLEESFEILGMGLVTAVDQAGGTFEAGTGSN